MSNLIRYCQDNHADAIGLACSVYAPVVDSEKDLLEIPLVSSYGPVMSDAVALGLDRVNFFRAATFKRRRILPAIGAQKGTTVNQIYV
ncbi:MAG: hypothetical protein Ct9H300mP11_19610 [Chloroflexota bacterium]|nr:MAG: hypothetical protein Ct9H300mP11_19610 [Chloroflexota bacterium]